MRRMCPDERAKNVRAVLECVPSHISWTFSRRFMMLHTFFHTMDYLVRSLRQLPTFMSRTLLNIPRTIVVILVIMHPRLCRHASKWSVCQAWMSWAPACAPRAFTKPPSACTSTPRTRARSRPGQRASSSIARTRASRVPPRQSRPTVPTLRAFARVSPHAPSLPAP